MKETRKMMEKILTGKECKVSEKQLISEYQEKLSPNILAYFYCNNYGLIYNVSQKYSIITDADKASFCLQILDYCLQNYIGNVKFMTYFISCYEKKLMTETRLLNLDKRKLNINCLDINNYDLTTDLDLTNYDLILDTYNLTDIEKEQCKLLNSGYTLTDIAHRFKISISAVCQRNKKIKQKILIAS